MQSGCAILSRMDTGRPRQCAEQTNEDHHRDMTKPEHTLNHAMGARLRAARQERSLSLSQLAEETGGEYSKSRISNYEQGLRRMSVEAALALAKALGNVTAAYLLCVDDDASATRQ